MRKYFTPVLIFVSTLLIASAAWAGFQKTKIAILDFKVLGKGQADTGVGDRFANQLLNSFEKDWRFEIVDPGLIDKVITEQQLVLDKKEHRLIITDSAKLLGAKVLISGFVIEFDDMIEIKVRVINVDNASIIAAEDAKTAADVPFEFITDQLIEKVKNIFPFEGVVVFRKGDRITIDLGRCDGVKSGMHFAVFKEYKVIRCPQTGRVKDCFRLQTGVFKVQEVKDKISIASISVEKIADPITVGQTIESGEKLQVSNDCK
jgi:TolB-like protein